MRTKVYPKHEKIHTTLSSDCSVRNRELFLCNLFVISVFIYVHFVEFFLFVCLSENSGPIVNVLTYIKDLKETFVSSFLYMLHNIFGNSGSLRYFKLGE